MSSCRLGLGMGGQPEPTLPLLLPRVGANVPQWCCRTGPGGEGSRSFVGTQTVPRPCPSVQQREGIEPVVEGPVPNNRKDLQ